MHPLKTVLFTTLITLSPPFAYGSALSDILCRLQAEFDHPGSEYAKYYDLGLRHLPMHVVLRQRHAEFHKEARGIMVDMAGGSGLVGREVRGPGKDVHIVDLSVPMTDHAVAVNGYKPSQIHISSITDMSMFADNSVAGITWNNNIYLLKPEEIAQAFKEAARILKPGGYLTVASMRGKIDSAYFLRKLNEEFDGLVQAGIIAPYIPTVFEEANKRLTTRPISAVEPEVIFPYGEQAGLILEQTSWAYHNSAWFMAWFKPQGLPAE